MKRTILVLLTLLIGIGINAQEQVETLLRQFDKKANVATAKYLAAEGAH